jgi:hypothetical protein
MRVSQESWNEVVTLQEPSQYENLELRMAKSTEERNKVDQAAKKTRILPPHHSLISSSRERMKEPGYSIASPEDLPSRDDSLKKLSVSKNMNSQE